MQQPPALTVLAQWGRAPLITETATLVQQTAAKRRYLLTRAIVEAAPMRAAPTTERPLVRRVPVASHALPATTVATATLQMVAKSI
jgi:hypothetical protein